MRDLSTTSNPGNSRGSVVAPEATTRSPGEATLLAWDRFETPEAALEEDVLRLKRARWVLPANGPIGWFNVGSVLALNRHRLRYPSKPMTVPRLDRAEVLGLIHKLDVNVAAERAIYPTLASSIAMRDIRLLVIGSLFDALSYLKDDEVRLITIVKPSWVMTPAQLLRTDARKLKRQLAQDLTRTGVSAMPGPLVLFLHGEFDPVNGVYILHFHGMTTPDKAEFLKKRLGRLRAYQPTPIVRRPIKMPRLGDRTRQLSYLLKAYWTQRALRPTGDGWKRDRVPRRIYEPWSTIAFVWLDRYRPIDLMIMNGAWSRRSGGSEAWRQFYLSARRAGETVGSMT